MDLSGKEVSISTSVPVLDQYETIPFGNYIVDMPNTEQLAQNTSSTAYDYMIKFRIPYVHRLKESFTASELFIDICEQAGVTAGNANFVNSDYVILGNAYTNNETCEFVLRFSKISNRICKNR